MALINTTTTGVLGTTIFGDGSGTLTVQENGVTINQISSTGLLNGRLTSMTNQASTSGTSIDFTGIPTWVKRITVMFSGVSTNGTSPAIMQIGISTGVETTGYIGSAVNAGNPATLYTTGFGVNNGLAAASVFSGIFIIGLIGSNTWAGNGQVGFSNAAALGQGAGAKTLGGTLDRVRITTVNGTDTFDAGSINILYE